MDFFDAVDHPLLDLSLTIEIDDDAAYFYLCERGGSGAVKILQAKEVARPPYHFSEAEVSIYWDQNIGVCEISGQIVAKLHKS
jgi:hypothetical protein